MIFAHLNVFGIYSAYLTAEDEQGFYDIFRSVVVDALAQYQCEFGPVDKSWTDRINRELTELRHLPSIRLEEISYDLRLDGDGYIGIVNVQEVFRTRQAVEEWLQPIVDDLNVGLDEDERWAVFGGGFFPATPGYEIDELFK